MNSQPIPEIPKVEKVIQTEKGLRAILSTKVTKETAFMGASVLIEKLSYATINEIQQFGEKFKRATDSVGAALTQEDAAQGFKTTLFVIRKGCPDLSVITDEEMQANVPFAELLELATEIMEFSGVGASGKGN